MNLFVKKPNLPVSNVTRVVAGKLPVSVKNELKKRNIEIITIENNSIINNSLSNHADLQLIHLGSECILINDNQKEAIKKLGEYGFNVDLFTLKGGKYPFDCAVNAAFLGKKVICKYEILEEKLKEHILKNNYNIINVNQGYSKCSVCVVNENSVITEDESVKNACEKHGIDVLLIRKGCVLLDGFDYGFIGGASFKINEKTLAFIGRVENHPDFTVINDFLRSKGIDYLSLGDVELTDVGSIIPVNE